jgi:hypothetical protein
MKNKWTMYAGVVGTLIAVGLVPLLLVTFNALEPPVRLWTTIGIGVFLFCMGLIAAVTLLGALVDAIINHNK